MANVTTTQTTNPNEIILPYLRDLLSEGRGIYENTPYTPYNGPRVAGFTPDQTAGMQQARNSVGVWQPYLEGAASRAGGVGDMAMQYAQQYAGQGTPQYDRVTSPIISSQVVGAKQFPGADMTAYMNPYESLVTGAAARAMQEAADRQMANAQAKFASSGAFGGSRQGLYEGTMGSQTARGIGELVNQSRMQNYTNAQGAWQKDADRLLQADALTAQMGLSAAGTNAGNILRALMANQTAGLDAQRLGLQGDQLGLSALGQSLAAAQLLGNLGNSASTNSFNDASKLLGIGGMQQGLDQKNMDVAYGDFQTERDYPWTQIQRYASLLNGNGLNNARTTTTSQPGPNEWAQLAGLLASGTGVLGATGAFGNNGWLTGGSNAGAGGIIQGGSGSDFGLNYGADAGSDLLGLGDLGGDAMDLWGYM